MASGFNKLLQVGNDVLPLASSETAKDFVAENEKSAFGEGRGDHMLEKRLQIEQQTQK